jgi:hypothetical protein
MIVQLKSKERELNAFKVLFKQTLSASGNTNLNNSIINSYLNGNNPESSSVTAQQSESQTSKGEIQSLSSNTASSLNDWSSPSTNSLSSFLPKI